MASHLTCCISWVPVQHEPARLHHPEYLCCFSSGRGIARGLILEYQNYILLARLRGGVLQLVVHCTAVRRLVFKPPEIEEANAICSERLRQLDTTFENLVLLDETEIGIELGLLGTEL